MFNLKSMVYILVILVLSIKSHAIPTPGDDGTVPPWIIIFQANTAGLVKVGKPVSINWTTANTLGCSMSSNLGSVSVSTSGSRTITPINTSLMIVTLTCVGEGGTPTSRTISFPVKAFDHPELTYLNSSPASSIITGGIITLQWDSEFASNCQLTGTHNESLPASGSMDYFAQSGLNTFHMTCSSNDGRQSNSMAEYVTGIAPSPIILGFYTSSVGSGNYHLNWRTSGAQSCFLDQTESVSTNGSRFFFGSNISRTHILRCTRNGFSETRFAVSP